ncbi:1214_t:CDS:2 [Paraglomus occultum]|uniref:1214_t:CDS:1 n=1 Tax=Paraglomus occultum TaxID=144539 RepID=A0A9N9BL59_9GLOM|nr:1214_t:CDS:2 [Paraglomus occultum]
MSIKVGGLVVSRATGQASQIDMIFTYINTSLEALTPEQKEDAVNISLSAYDLDNVNIREAILEKYDGEIIEKDLIIKRDGLNKTRIHLDLATSAMMQNSSWAVHVGGTCAMGSNSFRPDVGIWFRIPTFAQRSRPVANKCPPPNVWIEVFYDEDPDRRNALSKISFIRECTTNVEYVGIAIPLATNPFPQNENPGITTTPATPCDYPPRSPYIIHFPNRGSKLVYYRMNWNEHLDLRCQWRIEFNIVLNAISQP